MPINKHGILRAIVFSATLFVLISPKELLLLAGGSDKILDCQFRGADNGALRLKT